LASFEGGDAITDDYAGTMPWTFTGGTIKRGAVDVSGEPCIDLERESVAMLSRELQRSLRDERETSDPSGEARPWKGSTCPGPLDAHMEFDPASDRDPMGLLLG
jgi:hypothetical protein